MTSSASRNYVSNASWIDMKNCPHKSGIVVAFYRMCDSVDMNLQYMLSNVQSITCEELCMQACKYIGIGPMGYYLCGLIPVQRTTVNNIWLPPGHKIVLNGSTKMEFVLRVKFLPAMEEKKLRKLKEGDDATLQYFYYQCFDDFRNDRFSLSDSQKDILGVALLDNLIHDRLHQEHKLNAIYYVPKSCFKKHFNKYITQWRLNSQFYKKLSDVKDSYSELDTISLQILNLVGGLYPLIINYGKETFIASSNSEIDAVYVEPYGAKRGCTFSKGDVNDDCAFEDIMDLVVKDCDVMVHRTTGPPRSISFEHPTSALSFATCVDGYCRLSVEFYNQICSSPEVIGERALMLRKARCYGPIKIRAVLRVLRKSRDCDIEAPFLLAESQKQFNNFTLFFFQGNEGNITKKKKVPTEDKKYRFKSDSEKTFDSLLALLSHCKTNEATSMKLKNGIRPTDNKFNTGDSDLYLCRPSSADKNFDENDSAHVRVPQILKDVFTERIASQGKFTEVYEGTWSGGRCAIKSLTQAGQPFAMDFLRSIQEASFWNCEHIVRVFGVRLSPPSLIMELAPKGDLHRHLLVSANNLPPLKLCQIAEQVVLAVHYLQTQQLVHGNIRARNVLVFSSDFFIHVKLADPSFLWTTMTSELIEDKLPWLAPELYSNPTAITTLSDLFALSTTLYEIFSLGKTPFEYLTSKEIREAIFKDSIQRPDLCPEEIFSHFKSCWSIYENERPNVKDILREIRIYEMNDDGRSTFVGSSHSSRPMLSDASHVSVISDQQINRQNRANQVAAGRQLPSPDANSLASIDTHSSLGGNQWASAGSETPLIQIPTFGSQGNALSAAALSGTTMSTLLSNSQIFEPGLLGAMANLSRRFSNDSSSMTEANSIDRNRLILDNQKQTLGEGYYGSVYKGSLRTGDSNRVVAVKCLHFQSNIESDREAMKTEFKQEISLMQKLRHPNIVEIIGQCEDYRIDLPLLLVMEFVEKGSLHSYLQTNKKQLDLTDARFKLLQIGTDIAEGMKYLHYCEIIHRDLATRNVLVTKDDRAKIGDFGLSRSIINGVYNGSHSKAIPAPWCALESLVSRKFTKETDVWMYGVTLWEVFSLGQAPRLVDDLNNLSSALSKGKRLEQPRRCPDEIYALMTECWAKDWTKRPTFAVISKRMHSFLNQPLNMPN